MVVDINEWYAEVARALRPAGDLISRRNLVGFLVPDHLAYHVDSSTGFEELWGALTGKAYDGDSNQILPRYAFLELHPSLETPLGKVRLVELSDDPLMRAGCHRYVVHPAPHALGYDELISHIARGELGGTLLVPKNELPVIQTDILLKGGATLSIIPAASEEKRSLCDYAL